MLSNIFKRFNVVSAAGTALVGALVALALILAPQAALAAVASGKLTTNHWKQGATQGYSITVKVTVPNAELYPVMTLSGPQVSSTELTEDSAGTTFSATVPVATSPAGEIYTVNVTYFDGGDTGTPTAPEALNFTATALNSFATPVSPLGGVGPTANPTFTWSAPESGSVSSYRLAIYGLAEEPWLSAQILPSTLSAQYLPTTAEYPTSLVSGTLYGWSVIVFDGNGNSAENHDGTVMVGANLSGKVTDFAGAAVSGATVYVYNSSTGVNQGSATTGTDGSYLIGGLATSTTGYKVVFKKMVDGVQQTTNYNNRLDHSSPTYANYDPLPVTAGTSGVLKTGIDAVLGGWGAIAGKVVNSSTGISGITVQLLDANGNATSYPSATTNSSGIFTFSLLPPATYKVKAIGSPTYVDVTSDPLTVSAGQVTEPASISLGRVNLKGTVTDTGGAPIAGVWVYLLTTSGAFYPGFNGVQTGADGTYAISAGIGNYKILFSPVGSTYAKQYYNRKATATTADIITVSSTTVPLTGVNAVLGSGKPTVTEFTVPSTSSSLTVSGITFTAAEPVYGVAGYLITESATAPAASDAGWKTTAPTSYTFSGVGEKTLYAWAKGATGLISDSIARGVTVDASNVTPGDSDGNGEITISEVKLAIDMYLGVEPTAQFVDTDKSGSVTLQEVQKVVNGFLAH